MGYLRANPPTVPWDILAREYIDCVEADQHPGKTLRERYGISEKAWEHKRIHMSHDGWLPAGLPGRLYVAAWVREAREVYSARIRRKTQQIREHEESVRRTQEARMAPERIAAVRARRSELVAAARSERAAVLAELASVASPEARARMGECLTESLPAEPRAPRPKSRPADSRAVLDVFL